MAQLSNNEIADWKRCARLQKDFNQGQPIDIGPYSAILSASLNMGFSTTDALEAALVCGTTDDVGLICDYLLLSSEERKRQYLKAAIFDEKEEKETRAPQKHAPQPRVRNDELDKRHTSNVVQRSTESKLILNDNKSKDQSVYFYVDRCQIVDAYVDDIIHNEMPSQIIPHCIPRDISSLFEHLARFLRTLSPKSRQIIWDHAVKIKTGDGKIMCPQTKDKEQIIRLFCDCVIVYVKYVDRNIAPLCSSIWIEIEPQVENVAVFIHNEYLSLHRDKFESDGNYLAVMIEDYRNKTLVDHLQRHRNRFKYVGKISKYVMKPTETNTARVYGQKLEKKRVSQQYNAPQTPPMPPVAHNNELGTTADCVHMDQIIDRVSWNYLAWFFRILPPKSKQHIWKHAVKIKTDDGQKTVCEQTKNKKHIIRLLCDCVKGFVESVNHELDRAAEKISYEEARKRLNVEDVAVFILNKYHPLSRDKFENDNTYFVDMLRDYEQTHIVCRNGTTVKQTKTQLLSLLKNL